MLIVLVLVSHYWIYFDIKASMWILYMQMLLLNLYCWLSSEQINSLLNVSAYRSWVQEHIFIIMENSQRQLVVIKITVLHLIDIELIFVLLFWNWTIHDWLFQVILFSAQKYLNTFKVVIYPFHNSFVTDQEEDNCINCISNINQNKFEPITADDGNFCL